VVPALLTTLVVLAVAVAVLALVDVTRSREPGWWAVGSLGLLELGLLAQCVTGLVRLAHTGRDVSGLTFTAYLVGAVLVPPAAFVWAAAERTRWGSAVLVVAALAVVALEFRLDQIWGR
jgi:hypothetical protein